ncbi:MAG TPA: GTP cyclohydrolase II [Pyrinomonadaceae bacterium]|nr:GTP cyclohydrolase II [Pyrinomonadaceae bacterium]
MSRIQNYQKNEQGEVMSNNSTTTVTRTIYSTIYPTIKSVEKVAEARLPTEFGEFRIAGYKSLTSDEEFVCVFKGEFNENVPVPVRIHSQCLTGDVFHSIKCDCGPQLQRAMETIEKEGRGIIVYQQQEGRGIGIINKIRAYALQDEGADTIEANTQLGLEVDLRQYEQCVEILKDLGVRKIKAMSNNPEKLKAMRDGGLEIVERLPIEFKPSKDTQKYLSVKKFQMGHLLSLV